MTYGHCFINKDVSNAACYIAQLGAVGVRNLIPWKTLLKTSLESPSCDAFWSVRSISTKWSPLLGTLTVIHRYNRTQTHRDKHTVTSPQASTDSLIQPADQDDGRHREWKSRIQIWDRWWSDDSKGELFDFSLCDAGALLETEFVSDFNNGCNCQDRYNLTNPPYR